MSKCIILVVDVQTAIIQDHPYNERKVIGNIKRLISAAREHHTEVVYVRHNDEDLMRDTDGWQIYHEISPEENEKIFDKWYNSAFVHTSLEEYLKSKGTETIILVGLQTEYCIDATVKSAFERGYKVIIPEDTNTTFDNEYLPGEKLYEFFNDKLWNHRYAQVMPVEKAAKILGKV